MKQLAVAALLAVVLVGSVPGPAYAANATASTASNSTFTSPFAACLSRFSTKVSACVSEYVRAVQEGGNGAVCGALDTYFACLGDTYGCMPSSYQARWRQGLSAYRRFYNEGTCTFAGVDLGNVEIGMGFADPHYKKLDGTMVTCNDVGDNVLASSDAWTVNVAHTKVGTKGAIISSVSVEFLHPSAPTETFVYRLGEAAPAFNSGGIVVDEKGVRSAKYGLRLLVRNVNNGYFTVGIAGAKIKGGIVKNGCANPATLPSTIPSACQRLPESLQGACAFDAEQMNETWAVAAAREVEGVSNETDEGAVSLRSAGSGAAAGGLGTLVAVCGVLAAMLAAAAVF